MVPDQHGPGQTLVCGASESGEAAEKLHGSRERQLLQRKKSAVAQSQSGLLPKLTTTEIQRALLMLFFALDWRSWRVGLEGELETVEGKASESLIYETDGRGLT